MPPVTTTRQISWPARTVLLRPVVRTVPFSLLCPIDLLRGLVHRGSRMGYTSPMSVALAPPLRLLWPPPLRASLHIVCPCKNDQLAIHPHREQSPSQTVSRMILSYQLILLNSLENLHYFNCRCLCKNATSSVIQSAWMSWDSSLSCQ